MQKEDGESSEPARQTAGLSSQIRARRGRNSVCSSVCLGKITGDAGSQDSGYSLPMSGQLLGVTVLLLKYTDSPGNPKISLLSLPLVRIEALVPFVHSVASVSICIISATFLKDWWAWSRNYT